MSDMEGGRELPTPDRQTINLATTQPIYENDTCRGVCGQPHTHSGAYTILLPTPFTVRAATEIQFPLCGPLHVTSDGRRVSEAAMERLAWRIGHRDVNVDLPDRLVDAWIRGVVDLLVAGCFFGVDA